MENYTQTSPLIETTEIKSFSGRKNLIYMGLLGIFLPFILYVGNYVLTGCYIPLNAISSYYYSGMKDVFIVVLGAFGMFMFIYKGYDKWDYYYTFISGVCAICVAILPTSIESGMHECINETNLNGLVGIFHFIFAAGFFIALTILAFFQFTKTNNQLKRRIYRTCAVTMLAAIILIAVVLLWDLEQHPKMQWYPVFWLESIAVIAFGISWVVKSNLWIFKKI